VVALEPARTPQLVASDRTFHIPSDAQKYSGELKRTKSARFGPADDQDDESRATLSAARQVAQFL